MPTATFVLNICCHDGREDESLLLHLKEPFFHPV